MSFFWIRISIICLDLFVYLPVSVDFVRMDLDAVGVKGNDVFVSGVLWDITKFHFIKDSKKKLDYFFVGVPNKSFNNSNGSLNIALCKQQQCEKLLSNTRELRCQR